jgi:ubiquinone/menaquinone biosynthesis C-methylase UbiE
MIFEEGVLKKDKNRICPVEQSDSLTAKYRRWLQNPRKLLSGYVREGMTVLDYGCGPGFFTMDMAELAGESGKVIAADLQPGMLDKLRGRIRNTSLEKRIHLHTCTNGTIGVSEAVDFILAFYVFHEVKHIDAVMKEVRSVLKKGGYLYVAEPKFFHVSRDAFDQTVRLITNNGFVRVDSPGVFWSRAAVFQRRD